MLLALALAFCVSDPLSWQLPLVLSMVWCICPWKHILTRNGTYIHTLSLLAPNGILLFLTIKSPIGKNSTTTSRNLMMVSSRPLLMNYRHLQPRNHVRILLEVEPKSETEFKDTSRLWECYMMALNLNAWYKCSELEVELNDIDEDQLKAEANKEPRELEKRPFDYDTYQPYFLCIPRRKTQKTFESTTQFAVNMLSGTCITQTIKSWHYIWLTMCGRETSQ